MSVFVTQAEKALKCAIMVSRHRLCTALYGKPLEHPTSPVSDSTDPKPAVSQLVAPKSTRVRGANFRSGVHGLQRQTATLTLGIAENTARGGQLQR